MRPPGAALLLPRRRGGGSVGAEDRRDVRGGPELRRRAALRDVRGQRQRAATMHPRRPRRPPDQGSGPAVQPVRVADDAQLVRPAGAALADGGRHRHALEPAGHRHRPAQQRRAGPDAGHVRLPQRHLALPLLRRHLPELHRIPTGGERAPGGGALPLPEPGRGGHHLRGGLRGAPMGLTRVLNASGLAPYMFPVWRMPKSGGDWPRLSDMVRDNHRLLVFTSKAAKEAAEGIAYEWRYVVENQYGTKGMVKGTCHNRAESAAMNDLSRSLVLVNYFRDLPNFPEACKDNSAPLMDVLDACHAKSGDRWANFIAVDFYKRSDRGGAAEATDKANGGLVCGCGSISACNANGTCTPRHGRTPKGIFNASSDAAAWRPPPVMQWQRLVLLPALLAVLLGQ
ncbi:unnamed protein product [Urochloa humidicola]